MRDILAEIVEKKKDTVAAAKKALPLHEVKRRAEENTGNFAMSHRFRQSRWNLIAEC